MCQRLNRVIRVVAAGLCSVVAIGTASAQPAGGTGACCVRTPDGVVCRVVTGMVCRQAGGAFRGAGTTCEPNPCVQPPAPSGACCRRDGDANVTCVVALATRCREAGGALVLHTIHPLALKVLTTLRMHNVLTLAESEEDALKLARRPAKERP